MLKQIKTYNFMTCLFLKWVSIKKAGQNLSSPINENKVTLKSEIVLMFKHSWLSENNFAWHMPCHKLWCKNKNQLQLVLKLLVIASSWQLFSKMPTLSHFARDLVPIFSWSPTLPHFISCIIAGIIIGNIGDMIFTNTWTVDTIKVLAPQNLPHFELRRCISVFWTLMNKLFKNRKIIDLGPQK